MAKKPYKIPFRGKDMQEYPQDWYGGKKIVWRDNCVFTATVKLSGHYRGRSAARVTVINIDDGERCGEQYSLGLASFFDAVLAFGVTPCGETAHITGRWTFKKQGTNYGLAPVLVED